MSSPRTVAVHGADAACHEYHTGVPGSFAELWRVVEAWRRRGEPVLATTLLTRSSFRVLHQLPSLLRSRGVAEWRIEVPRADGALPFERLMPRLALALPFALHAMGRAEQLGLPASIRGAPLCLLGPHAERALPDAPRAFASVCAECPARASCPGVDGAYLSRFGGDELRPRPIVEHD